MVTATIIFAIVILSSAHGFLFNGAQFAIRSLGQLQMAKTPLVANGKRVEADEGSSMIQACSKLGLKVPTKCKKGECGTCTVTVGGKKIRACIGKVPDAPRLKSLIEKGLEVKVDNA